MLSWHPPSAHVNCVTLDVDWTGVRAKRPAGVGAGVRAMIPRWLRPQPQTGARHSDRSEKPGAGRKKLRFPAPILWILLIISFLLF